jgi:type II restriction enzyme
MSIDRAIEACRASTGYFFKYVSANDAGVTGAHQAGFYMPQDIWPLFLSEPGKKGENSSKPIDLIWPDGGRTESRFIWYGKNTRSEYRLTRGFAFLRPENVGDVLIVTRGSSGEYNAFLLSSDADIEGFFDELGISPSHAYRFLRPTYDPIRGIEAQIAPWLARFPDGFPPSSEISRMARELCASHIATQVRDPDTLILAWISQEFDLFKSIELREYSKHLMHGFVSVEEIVQIANTILNRRKSRAGYSLENHLDNLFTMERINFTPQALTERNKRADFIFPSQKAYRDPSFPDDALTFLGVKTTCKDRWRQILNEADRIPNKHLLTLQQAISSNQLAEMRDAGVILVVPESYRKTFPREFQSDLLSLKEFLHLLHSRQRLSNGNDSEGLFVMPPLI